MQFFESSPSTSSLEETRIVAAKKTIRSKVIEAIKDIQAETSHAAEFGNCAMSSTLCMVFEAMFIHGMKHSFINKLTASLRSGGVKSGALSETEAGLESSKSQQKMPQTHFWLYVMVYTHKDTLKSIDSLSNIKSDVGRCRAWIRVAINDGLMGSYISSMAKDQGTARNHYQRSAFMRDQESLEIVARYILGLEMFKFDLTANSSILNRWQTPPLTMAGIWIPDQVSEPPPVEAIDVVEQLDEEESEKLRLEALAAAHIKPLTAHGGNFLRRGLLNEDEAIKFILRGESLASSPTSEASSKQDRKGGTSKSKNKGRGKTRARDPKQEHDRRHECKPVGANKQSESMSPPSPSPEVKQGEPENVASATMTSDPPMQDYNRPSVSPGEHEVSIAEETSQERLQFDGLDVTEDTETPRQEDELSIEESIYNLKPGETILNKEVPEDGSGQVETNEVKKLVEELPPEVSKQTETIDDVKKLPIDPGETHISLLEEAAKRVSRSSHYETTTLPCLSGFIHNWNPFGNHLFFDEVKEREEDSEESAESSVVDLVLQPDMSVGSLTVQESHSFMRLFDRVPKDVGLDKQDYRCNACCKAIGSIFGPARLCFFTKRYYCDECLLNDVSVIPSRIVYNWDFARYHVCCKAKRFLDTFVGEPFIRVENIRADLFQFAPELDDVLTLRKKLYYVRLYLSTCRNSDVLNKFEEKFASRPYLCKETDKLAINDFEDIRNGSMKILFSDAVAFGKNHIEKCELCSGKGFICEVCRHEQPIYPFDLDDISQCQKCFTVFHLECSTKLLQCPKCERIESRNLNWHVTNCKMQREIVA